jgi:hypothetical protein
MESYLSEELEGQDASSLNVSFLKLSNLLLVLRLFHCGFLLTLLVRFLGLRLRFRPVLFCSPLASFRLILGRLKRLTEQRRRWNNSTLENTFVVISIEKLWRRSPWYMVTFFLSGFVLVFYFSRTKGCACHGHSWILHEPFNLPHSLR